MPFGHFTNDADVDNDDEKRVWAKLRLQPEDYIVEGWFTRIGSRDEELFEDGHLALIGDEMLFLLKPKSQKVIDWLVENEIAFTLETEYEHIKAVEELEQDDPLREHGQGGTAASTRLRRPGGSAGAAARACVAATHLSAPAYPPQQGVEARPALPSVAHEKVIRDTFTFPSSDHKRTKEVIQEGLLSAIHIQINKSQVTQAGLLALQELPPAKRHALLASVEKMKPGRPVE